MNYCPGQNLSYRLKVMWEMCHYEQRPDAMTVQVTYTGELGKVGKGGSAAYVLPVSVLSYGS